MADAQYHRQYWQRYRHKKRRVTLTLSREEYREWEARAKANGRTVAAQIKAEADAYSAQERLPDEALRAELAKLVRILRGIGNNLNQMARHSNVFRRVLNQRQTIDQLVKLEQAAEQFIRDNHQ